MKQLHLTLLNIEGNEIFSDYIKNIDCVDSHTIIYHKTNFSEADVIRLHFNLQFISISEGKIYLYYDNGIHAEVIRK